MMEPGFHLKKSDRKRETSKAGGISYLFESEETAQAYIKKHTARLKIWALMR